MPPSSSTCSVGVSMWFPCRPRGSFGQPVFTTAKPDSPNKLYWPDLWLDLSSRTESTQNEFSHATCGRVIPGHGLCCRSACPHIPGTESDSLKVSDSSRVVLSPLRDVHGYTSKQKSRSGCDSPARSRFCWLEQTHSETGLFFSLFCLVSLFFILLFEVEV